MKQSDLNELYLGFEHFFPEKSPPNNKPFLRWRDRADFVKEIKSLTNIDIASGNQNLIKASQQALEKIAVSTEKAEANTLTPEQLETFEKERTAKEEKRQEVIKESKAEVERAVQKQQEFHDKLAAENKKIFVKVERVIAPPTPEEIKADEAVAELKTKYEAGNHQREMAEDLAKVIKEKITPTLGSELSSEEIGVLSRDTAVKFVEAINNPEVVAKYAKAAEQTAILEAAALDTRVVPEGSRVAAGNIAAIRSMSAESTRAIINASFGEGFGKFFGPPIDTFKVSFYENSVSGAAYQLDLGKIDSGYAGVLDQQSMFLGNVGGMAQEEARSFLFNKISDSVGSRIMSLPGDNVLRGLYQNEGVRNLLSITRGQPISIAVDSSFLTGFAAKVPGGMGLINGIGNIFGINLVSGGAAAEVAGGAIATVGSEAAGAVVGATAVEAAGAAAAPLTGGLSLVVTTIIALVGPKVIGFIKDNIGKYGKWIVGGTAAIIGGLFFGTTGAIVGFFGGVGGATLISGGVPALGTTASSIGTGLVSFLGVMGSATLGAVGAPILATILGFPIVVALILFIINSGAYITPSSSYSNLGPRDCSIGGKIVDRAKAINNNLQLGFNQYYNKSPDYPELWNATLFAKNPNPDNQNVVIGMEDMFWCNYMPIKSYLAINEDIPFSLTAIMNYFQSQGRWISGDIATTDNLCPGDAIFFRSPADALLLAHVAVVYSVSTDEIVTVQSNSKWKTMTYFTDASGRFPVYGSGNDTIKIVGFGAP
jgi:hypothetical protein